MLRNDYNVQNQFRVYCAGAFCIFSFLIAYFSLYAFFRVEELITYLPAIFIFSAVLIISLLMRNFSISRFSASQPFYIAKEIAIGLVAGFLVYGFISYGFKLKHISRLYLGLSAATTFFAEILWFSAVSGWYSRTAGQEGERKVLLVGNRYTVQAAFDEMRHGNLQGVRFVGILPLSPESFEGVSFLGCPIFPCEQKDFDAFFNRHVVDSVFLTVYRQNPAWAEQIILTCQRRGIDVWLKPDFLHRAIQASQADYFGMAPVLVFRMGPEASFSLIFKRLFDFVAGVLILGFLSPLMLLLAYLIRRESPGPAVFVQRRVGLNGRKFKFYKFRSMYNDAEQRREQYRQKNEMQGPVFKMKDDPRITRIGRFIRKYSLDELPQLWNVVKGDMSLVGPRPPLPTEVDLYSGWHRRRLSMRPGITCIWQVSGRNSITDFQDWVKLDLQYIDNWSLALDFQILLKTIPAVIKGTGV